MADELKAPVVPKTTDDGLIFENRRAEIEKQVITENETIPELEVDSEEAAKIELKQEEPKVEEPIQDDPVDRIKKSVQKRIDKVVAQKKSAEEELAEVRAENERLKANLKPAETQTPQNNEPPTIEQIKAYIIQMSEEGKKREEVEAISYLIQREKEEAIKAVKEEQTKAQKESETQKATQLKEWTGLCEDYIVYAPDGKPDPKHELTLANQNGLLYKTALALYNDKELHAEHYNDPNVLHGFRRAVADAFKEIHLQGLLKTPKGEQITEPRRNPREILAEPEAEIAEETVQSTNSSSLSDAEKVREEIKNRKKNRFTRPLPK
jgi:hypothetical protein